ncbi:hypothetical protein F4810DRAFT_541183 [Camillea tinctor]|nr:hypothetical protein F4810DRAFT_541183 [Camillea tinctor]
MTLHISSKINMSLVQQFCTTFREPATAKRYRDAGFGILFIVLNQLLIIPTQIALKLHSINLPASIIVMLFLSTSIIVAGYFSEAVGPFYRKHLQGPSDFLGRHMSFGFVALFLMLNRDHITNSSDIPKIAAAFIITTIMSYVAAFAFAAGGFKLERQLRGLRQKKSNDLESNNNNKSWPSPSSTPRPATPVGRSSKPVAKLPALSSVLEKNGSLSSIESATQAPKTTQSRLVDFVVRTAPFWLCLFLLATVGFPVYLATRYEMPFEALSFLLLWMLCVQFLRYVRATPLLSPRPRLRSALVILANPLLLTWALGSAYLWVKVACTGQSIAAVATGFRRHGTLADCVAYVLREGGGLRSHVGAGDLAAPILDAGIVVLGFKLYEYRAELWSSCGAVVATCTALAAVNVFANAAVGAAVGLSREEAVAFAGRSVTMALGVPAIENLGGSTTLMSAVAIFSGVLFQMTGDWLFAVMRVRDRNAHYYQQQQQKQQCSVLAPSLVAPVPEKEGSGTPAVDAKTSDDDSTEKASPMMVDVNEKTVQPSSKIGCGNYESNSENQEAVVVAAGVTVGINAAAMGTAYLIERDSRATAYSALAMTVFGAMTVALAALPGAKEAMVYLTS